MQIKVSRKIDAPLDTVFNTVAHIDQFSQALPHVAKFEFLSEKKKGVGTKFCETRTQANGKEMRTELEVTEYIPNDRVRMVNDTHGTIWDTVFVTKEIGNQVQLEMVMDARAHKLMPRLINPLIKGMVQKQVEKDMDFVKQYCESQS